MLLKLKNALAALKAQNVSDMGYEAQIRHCRRIEHAQRRYDQALARARQGVTTPDENTGTSPASDTPEEQTSLTPVR